MQKISKYDAAVDNAEEGGIDLLGNDDHVALDVEYAAIKPDLPEHGSDTPQSCGSYPPLPSKPKKNGQAIDDLTAKLRGVSLRSESESVQGENSKSRRGSTALGAWKGGKSAGTLFPSASATPAPSEWSIEHHDRQMEEEQGINIMTTRFWDPTSGDFNPERFYDTVLQVYYCPFICE